MPLRDMSPMVLGWLRLSRAAGHLLANEIFSLIYIISCILETLLLNVSLMPVKLKIKEQQLLKIREQRLLKIK